MLDCKEGGGGTGNRGGAGMSCKGLIHAKWSCADQSKPSALVSSATTEGGTNFLDAAQRNSIMGHKEVHALAWVLDPSISLNLEERIGINDAGH